MLHSWKIYVICARNKVSDTEALWDQARQDVQQSEGRPRTTKDQVQPGLVLEAQNLVLQTANISWVNQNAGVWRMVSSTQKVPKSLATSADALASHMSFRQNHGVRGLRRASSTAPCQLRRCKAGSALSALAVTLKKRKRDPR